MEIHRADIEKYLHEVYQSIHIGKYQISARAKNQQIYMDYIFSEENAKQVILGLTVDDFSDIVRNNHPNHAEELLYIFGKDIWLDPRFGGEKEKLSLYIKFNKLNDQYVFVISLHKQEYPLTYKFR